MKIITIFDVSVLESEQGNRYRLVSKRYCRHYYDFIESLSHL